MQNLGEKCPKFGGKNIQAVKKQFQVLHVEMLLYFFLGMAFGNF